MLAKLHDNVECDASLVESELFHFHAASISSCRPMVTLIEELF